MATLQLSELGRRNRSCARSARSTWGNKDVPLNIALLRQVEDAIMETPHQFTMLSWHDGDVYPGAQDKISGQACILGWAVVLSDRVRLSSLSTSRIETRARQVLGISPSQSRSLFILGGWPEEYRCRYLPESRDYLPCVHNAQLAAARTEAFIESTLREKAGGRKESGA